ncbi:MAG: M23 family metallopeptidase [Bacteroidales bacterium]|nr:M23 family metallopeptidase [Bacteroidales bacterium]
MKKTAGRRWEEFRLRMREKYQLIVRNKAFEEKFSVELSLWRFAIIAVIGVTVLIALTTLLIAFTPLREYIPGYGSAKQAKKLFALQVRMDSLSNQLNAYDQYVNNLQQVINEDFASDTDAFRPKEKVVDKASVFAFSKEDSAVLSLTLHKQEKPSGKTWAVSREKQTERHLLFQPVNAPVARPYSTEDPRLTLRTTGSQPLYAIDAGCVIQADRQWLCIQHTENRLSIYRNIGQALVQNGEHVRGGQVIARSGSDSQPTIFEYWINGKSANPQEFFDFE